MIGCADHCVYVGVGTPNLYLGGRVVVGSELAKNMLAMPSCNSIL